jgi:hypothetical protein
MVTTASNAWACTRTGWAVVDPEPQQRESIGRLEKTINRSGFPLSRE